jgi:predicted peptidase
MYKIESMLSARIFQVPQIVGDRIYFISNLSGRLSLYAMNYGGSVPEPLLPPDIALQNPHLLGGEAFYVYPGIGKILVMLDKDGDEVYQPVFIPIEGGYPERFRGDVFEGHRVYLGGCDSDRNIAYFSAASLTEPNNHTYLANLKTGEVLKLAESKYGFYPDGHNLDHSKVFLIEGYTIGDNVLFLWDKTTGKYRRIYGKPLSERSIGEEPPLNSIYNTHFIREERGTVFHTTLLDDQGGLGYLDLENPNEVRPVSIEDIRHTGMGEFLGLTHLHDQSYLARYNIDGCDWAYEGILNEELLKFQIQNVICGEGMLSNGVIDHISYDKSTDRYVLTFSTATSPTQIYTVESKQRNRVTRHTHERILGIPDSLLSNGEDASYTSFDGTRISARLYLPAEELNLPAPYPLVYYVHGGPQSQERPDFAWFSMPLIQYLTLNGFAVFVPNVRGSTGYGLSYTKQVDRDWGGKDRLDHVHAMKEVLPKDPRIDVSHSGVVGRSYGGYMTLMLAFRHPELWAAAVDMFGPYDLLTFSERIPETWKPYYEIALGHPENDREFLIERSPKTYMENLTAPMLVIQGKNDPRVVARESEDVVEQLRSMGKQVEYLRFENEGHDVLKYENRVTCYTRITDFFKQHLQNSAMG